MDVTDDSLLGGRLRFRQPRVGYRAGMDAALLAAACDARAGDRVLEAGCGSGGALVSAAARRPLSSFVGIDTDLDAVALARDNIRANQMSDRVQAIESDIARPFASLGLARFNSAMANPPYFDDERSLRGPHPAKRQAWITDAGLAAWIAFLLASVQTGGVITIIHRSDRLADILDLLSEGAGSVQIRPVHAYDDAPAKRVLVRAVRSGRGPLRLLPALVMHARGGAKHTPQADTILRGEADIEWL